MTSGIVDGKAYGLMVTNNDGCGALLLGGCYPLVDLGQGGCCHKEAASLSLDNGASMQIALACRWTSIIRYQGTLDSNQCWMSGEDYCSIVDQNKGTEVPFYVQ